MRISFELRSPPGADLEGKPHPPIEYVRVEVGGGDIVNREATEADRRTFRTEYAAFRAAQYPSETTESAPSTWSRLSFKKKKG